MRKTLLLLLGVSLLGCAVSGAHAPSAPVLPEAVELRFSDFFVRPVGPRGHEPTPRLLELDGRRVRIRGFLVDEEEPYPGLFMLTEMPVSIAERADGPADFLPPATLFVHLPDAERDRVVAHGAVPIEVTGTLELGAREEVSGRVSYVRLRLDDLAESHMEAHKE